ncbi:hypothetical protein LQK89_02570 [Curtobacterium sp. C1]|uniref:hypothetical protein n=1 Tax=Curtobacterium sp. C1 TaxID=2898151 RepID=UPI001E427D10|nr:hypothetical protein [Curtobacterium sp. C1]UFU14602.1 hypothetical protein LQK89_02570 [Curtobacterium sp. C1]
MNFNTDIAVTFVGLVAALFVATLIIKSFESRKRTSTGNLVVHFGNFVVTTILLLFVIAGENTMTGLAGGSLWLLGAVSTGGSLVMLAIDLRDRRKPAATTDDGDKHEAGVAGAGDSAVELPKSVDAKTENTQAINTEQSPAAAGATGAGKAMSDRAAPNEDESTHAEPAAAAQDETAHTDAGDPPHRPSPTA